MKASFARPEMQFVLKFLIGSGMRNHAIVVCEDGDVICFGGSNREGQCDFPRTLPFGVWYISAASGLLHSVLVKSDGVAFAVGDNFHGQCEVPALPEGVRYVSAAAGDSHTMLLRSDGQVESCGDNSDGQCSVPELPEGVVYSFIAAGSHHSILIRSDGTAVAFGYNQHRQCSVRRTQRCCGLSCNEVQCMNHLLVIAAIFNVVKSDTEYG